MFEFLGSMFTSILSGGMTGIFGVAVQRFADYKNKQLDAQVLLQKQAHEIALREIDSKIMAQEWAGRTRVAEAEATGKEAAEDAKAFAASFSEPSKFAVATSSAQNWLFVILDFIRGIVRPVLTVYLCILTTAIYVHAKGLLASDMSHGEAYELVKLIVGTILYLFTTCLLWWFGVRNKQPGPKIS